MVISDICQGIKCRNRTRCESGVCVCPTDCEKDLSVSVTDEPVCASDMNTYSNECEMQKHACLHSLNSLSVLFYGDCKERIDASLLRKYDFMIVLYTYGIDWFSNGVPRVFERMWRKVATFADKELDMLEK